MGKATGFIEIARAKHPVRPVVERLRDWREVYEPYPEAGLKDQAARCMDCGIPFCHQRLPARKPDSRLERSRLPQPVADGDRSAARDQQLPRVHRPAVPGAVRGRVRPRHQQRSGDDQVDRGLDHRSRVRGGLGYGPAAGAADRQARRRRRLRAGGSGRGRSVEPRRSSRHGLRARRSHRRAPALRDPRVQAREAPARSAARAARRGRRDLPHQLQHRRRRRGRRAATRVRRDRARRRLDAPARPAGARPRARAASTSRWSISRCRTAATRATGLRTIASSPRRTSTSIIIGGGDTGADCLGTAHRQGARAVRQLELLPRPPDARASDQPVAAVAEHLPRLDGARGRRRPALRRRHAAIRRTTGMDASRRCTPTRSRW